jgi:hypothetical protein
MDKFIQLQPEGGFRAAAQLVWSGAVASHVGASRASTLNRHASMEPVYGGNGSTWIDRFSRLEPRGGFRSAAERVWNGSAPTIDERLASFAAALRLAETVAA